MASTTSARLPNFSAQNLKATLGRFWLDGRRQWSYDVFPCPIDLFEILADITMLSKTQRAATISDPRTVAEVDSIRGRLVAWQYPEGISGPRRHMVEVWRLGVMAYLGRLFPIADLPDTSDLTSQVLHHGKLIPPATSWSYSILWPIFQVGVTLDSEALDERAWIQKRLNIALEAVGCRHFSNALETLRFVWDNGAQDGPVTSAMNGRTIMLA